MQKQNMNATFEPNFAVAPGETLAETLETLGMTQVELADRSKPSTKSSRARPRLRPIPPCNWRRCCVSLLRSGPTMSAFIAIGTAPGLARCSQISVESSNPSGLSALLFLQEILGTATFGDAAGIFS